ncbi:hypothetical protein QL285_050778 [Trifolium repens]|nr:hypothetical protein QL285_050778 [Trifolium repens]
MRESEERETGVLGGSARAKVGKRKGFFHHLDKVTTSFFITNFPEESTTGDLWKLFLKYGRVGEVYIPKKLDKRGKRFGFVKFKEVEDVEELTERLRDVWVGSFKIWVNRSRFARSENKEEQPQQTPATRPAQPAGERRHRRSFKTALLENGESSEVIKVPVNEELCKELRGSVVGRLARERNVKRIQTTLFMEGFPSISVTHMGDNKVLMRSPVEGDVERLMKSKNECLKYYFSELKPWNPGLTAAQREVWVQIYGIPVHIWGDDLFKLVGKQFGVFLDYDEETARMKRLDVARIKILSTVWASIDVVLKVEVEGLFFDLWVVEERERKSSVAVLNEEMEDEGSKVVPAEDSVGGEDVYGEGASNSGEDEESGEELDVDVVIGEGHEDENDGTGGSLKLNEGEIALTCTKSKDFVNTNMEIPYAPQAVAEKVEQVGQVLSLASSEEVGVGNEIGVCGSKLIEETNSILENVGTGGPNLDVGILNDVAGYQDPVSDPCEMGRGEPNLVDLDHSFRGGPCGGWN